MNQLNPEFLKKCRNVFAENRGMMLLDVRQKVAAEPETVARRHTLSALDTVAKKFQKPLHTITATPAGVRSLFRDHNAGAVNLQPKRYANIRSEIIRAVKKYGVMQPTLTKRIPLTDEWEVLLSKVKEPDYASGLTRLACFCSKMGFAPTGIDSDILGCFFEALVGEEFLKDPKKILQLTITYWNMQGRRVPNWPPVRLSSPFPSNQYILPLSEFPPSFAADLTAWSNKQTGMDVLDEDGPEISKRETTVSYQVDLIRRFASLLIKHHHLTLGEVTSLSALVKPDLVKAGLKIYLDTTKDPSKGQTRTVSLLMLSVARHYVKAAEPDIQKLAEFARRLIKEKRKGLTDRNIERLRQFDKPENIEKLLDFPMKERDRGLKARNPYRQAKYFERAAAAAILIHASIRIRNLCHMQIGKNIFWRGEEAFVDFNQDETKNRRALKLPLPPAVSALIREYIDHYRPRLPGAHGPYLFPGEKGGPRHHSTVRSDFKKAVWKHTGLEVNPHLMRHFVGKLVLDKHPELIYAVSQVLGHANVQTTIDYYLGNGSLSSSRIVNQFLEDKLRAARIKKAAKRGKKPPHKGQPK